MSIKDELKIVFIVYIIWMYTTRSFNMYNHINILLLKKQYKILGARRACPKTNILYLFNLKK